MDTDLTKEYLTQLGFDTEPTTVLHTLLTHGKQSILDIARNSGIERTKVYRIIDQLLHDGFVVQIKDYKRHYYQISSIDRFEQQRKENEERAERLIDNWAGFAQMFTNTRKKERSTDVRYYRGPDGIKQILWNELNAKDEVLSFTYRDLQEAVGRKFFLEWGQRFEEKNLICRDLRTQEFEESKQVSGYKHAPFKGDVVRRLPQEHQNMPLAVDVYNDVVVLYDWQDSDIFGVEIINQKFADFMRIVFESFWEKGVPAT